ncbi:MAG TPA: integrase arm-type DNA-binding domain-containing protein [Candidatus Kapabacteria bacterium]|nr:integrase arm-type DNA-binding domain-containing protein [Candidatus Kapabacteria bacterium]
MKLYDKDCKNAKPHGKAYKLFDGKGLYLEVTPSGGKLWRLKYYYLGKEKRISLGSYPVVTLASAREKCLEAKKLLDQEIDPSTAKQERRRDIRRRAANSFEAVALEWHKNQTSRWSARHAHDVLHRLQTDVFPTIGKRPINEIEVPDLLEALRRIEGRGALHVARRTRQICGEVFRYGIQTGRCKEDISVHLRGALKTYKIKHFTAIDTREIPDLLQALERNDGRLYDRTRRAVKLSR